MRQWLQLRKIPCTSGWLKFDEFEERGILVMVAAVTLLQCCLRMFNLIPT
jgi:hypothetical protein